MFLSSLGGGGWWLLMVVLCQAVLDSISKVYGKAYGGNETVRRESRLSPHLQMPNGFPVMAPDTMWGEG